jgi:hypothetical protein
MNISELVLALKSNGARIDAIGMELVQEAAENPSVYRGKGYVEQDESGALRFKLYTTERVNADVASHFGQIARTVPGLVYAADEYYSLRLRSFDGPEWTSDRILPSASWPAEGGPIITGALRRIIHAESVQSTDYYVRVHFFDRPELPLLPAPHGDGAEGQSKFKAAGVDITVNQYVDETIIDGPLLRSDRPVLRLAHS